VIQFALLFALGFLTAIIIGLLVAPAIHRRIVRFAEDRLKATMPLSPQEVRAQKDAARAAYAAENARTQQALKRERDKGVSLMLANEKSLHEARRLGSENADLHAQLADMNVEAADMRSAIRQFEQRLERMKATLDSVERDNAGKSDEIQKLGVHLAQHAAEIDNLKITLVARETEVEHLKSRIATLRDEREALRGDLKAETTHAKEMEIRLSRDETRLHRLEDKLAREMATSADRESALERRAGEIERLKTKVKDTNQEMRDAAKALRAAGIAFPLRKERRPATEPAANGSVSPPDQPASEIAGSAAADDLRNRATALSERLTNSKSAAHDDALRDEVAAIAAGMVALTATNEGPSSPILNLLAGEEQEQGAAKRESLAKRAKDILPRE
jgi:DNA repair exonuclease SbcCD ATPase subunit